MVAIFLVIVVITDVVVVIVVIVVIAGHYHHHPHFWRLLLSSFLTERHFCYGLQQISDYQFLTKFSPSYSRPPFLRHFFKS